MKNIKQYKLFEMISHVVVKYNDNKDNGECPVYISHKNNISTDKVVKMALKEFRSKQKGGDIVIEEFIIKSTGPAI